jgi:hypothetical protein
MDFEDLVVRDGDMVTGSGRLVRNRTGDWFEPLLAAAAAAVGGGRRMVRPVSPVAIPIAEADFDELANRFENDEAVEGFATLTGILSAGRLRVFQQAIPLPTGVRSTGWVMPPCPPPEGGWPRHRKNLHFDLGDLNDMAAVVAVTVFRPGQDQEVLVVAAADVDAVETRLRPRLGRRLCVVASRWTTAELDVVRGHLHAHHREWNLLQLAQTSTEDGQACINVKLTWVVLEIASWVSSLPSGMVSLDPWLRRA